MAIVRNFDEQPGFTLFIGEINFVFLNQRTWVIDLDTVGKGGVLYPKEGSKKRSILEIFTAFRQ